MKIECIMTQMWLQPSLLQNLVSWLILSTSQIYFLTRKLHLFGIWQYYSLHLRINQLPFISQSDYILDGSNFAGQATYGAVFRDYFVLIALTESGGNQLPRIAV